MLNIPVAPVIEGTTHVHSGKVRDLYRIDEGEHAGRLLMVASDRISAFDFVLQPTIPDKGEILTRMSLWWFEQLSGLVDNHVVSTDVPKSVAGRAVICESLVMFPVECVARGYLTGSGLSDYRRHGSVCGVELPAGLQDGSRLPEPIFTPATKAELGDHDENVDYEAVVEAIGDDAAAELRMLTLEVYDRAHGLARERGIILADTKFEFGRRPDGTTILADEVLTPDSSRFWPADEWQPGRTQTSYDKQVLRDWMTSAESGWDRTSGDAPPGPARGGRRADPLALRRGLRAAHGEHLLTGRTFRARVEIARPVPEVFDYLADPRNRPEWQSSLRSVEVFDDGPPREDVAWRDTTVVGVRPALTIIEYDRPRAWVEHGTWRGVSATLRLDFDDAATGCEVLASGIVEGRGPWAVPALAAGALAGRALAADLRRAGRILERRGWGG